jgi:hypothetical protein
LEIYENNANPSQRACSGAFSLGFALFAKEMKRLSSRAE